MLWVWVTSRVRFQCPLCCYGYGSSKVKCFWKCIQVLPLKSWHLHTFFFSSWLKSWLKSQTRCTMYMVTTVLLFYTLILNTQIARSHMGFSFLIKPFILYFWKVDQVWSGLINDKWQFSSDNPFTCLAVHLNALWTLSNKGTVAVLQECMTAILRPQGRRRRLLRVWNIELR